MVANRVNDTDPVIQVRLRVMVGNFHGAHRVRLVAGFVYPVPGIVNVTNHMKKQAFLYDLLFCLHWGMWVVQK